MAQLGWGKAMGFLVSVLWFLVSLGLAHDIGFPFIAEHVRLNASANGPMALVVSLFLATLSLALGWLWFYLILFLKAGAERGYMRPQ